MFIYLAVLHTLYQNYTSAAKSLEKIDKNVQFQFLLFSPILNAGKGLKNCRLLCLHMFCSLY